MYRRYPGVYRGGSGPPLKWYLQYKRSVCVNIEKLKTDIKLSIKIRNLGQIHALLRSIASTPPTQI